MKEKYRKIIWIEVIPFLLFLWDILSNYTYILIIFYTILIIRNLFFGITNHSFKIKNIIITNIIGLIIGLSFAITFRNQLMNDEIDENIIYPYIAFIFYCISFFRISFLKTEKKS